MKPTSEHDIDNESQTDAGGVSGQKFVIDPIWGGSGNGIAGMGISVGTNGVSVYEHADNYMPALLSWAGTVSDWTHVAVVYENKTPRLYINGVFVKTGLQSLKDHIHPGNLVASGSYGTMTGEVDEARVWKAIRTQDEIVANMNRSVTPQQPDLAAYWPIGNNGDGATLEDVTGNGNDVTLNSSYATGSFTGSGAPVTTEDAYRYGFNGKENDKDISEGGQDYGMRIYDSRLGKFASIDPISNKYPFLTPYQFASNRPIDGIDLDGLEFYESKDCYVRLFATYSSKLNMLTSVQVLFRTDEHVLPAGLVDDIEKANTCKNCVGSTAARVATFKLVENPIISAQEKMSAEDLSTNAETPSLAMYDGTTQQVTGDSKGVTQEYYHYPFTKATATLTKVGVIIDVAGKLSQAVWNNFETGTIAAAGKQGNRAAFVASIINNALLAPGLIDPKFQNQSSLNQLGNYLLFGETPQKENGEENAELVNLGKKIWEQVTSEIDLQKKAEKNKEIIRDYENYQKGASDNTKMKPMNLPVNKSKPKSTGG